MSSQNTWSPSLNGTFPDRVPGKVSHGTNPGPQPYLTKAEETEVSNFLIDVAKGGVWKIHKADNIHSRECSTRETSVE